MLRSIMQTLIVAGLALNQPCRTFASLLVDQVHDIERHPHPDGLSMAAGASASSTWQTFTVGRAGKLTNVDLGLYAERLWHEPLTVEITRTLLGSPDLSPAGLLASSQLLPSEVPISNLFALPIWTRVDFADETIDVTDGQQLAIVLRGHASYGDGYYWRCNAPLLIDSYPGGRASVESNFYQVFVDLHFRTFVQPVPEPTSLALTAALVAILNLRRQRMK